MKAKNIREMSDKKRAEMLSELRRELMQLRSQVRAGLTPDNSSRIKHVRKDIARLLTINGGSK
jgi:ribosomal protein L29